ncbi:hypothetical protein Tco_0077560 [Tanacetum coccineum]
MHVSILHPSKRALSSRLMVMYLISYGSQGGSFSDWRITNLGGEYRFHGINKLGSGKFSPVSLSLSEFFNGGWRFLHVRGMTYEVELGKYLAMVFSGLGVLVMIAERRSFWVARLLMATLSLDCDAASFSLFTVMVSTSFERFLAMAARFPNTEGGLRSREVFLLTLVCGSRDALPSLVVPLVHLSLPLVSLSFQPRTYNLSTLPFRDSVHIVENDLVVKKFLENDLDVKKFREYNCELLTVRRASIHIK